MIDNIIVILYLGVVLIIGIVSGRKVKNLEDFSVAGRSFKWPIVFATLSASFIGGGFSMGNASKVYTMGIVYIFALWGFSIKEILVSQFIVPRIKQYKDPISVGDMIGHHYGTIAKVITGCFSVLLCAGILGAQIGGIGYIFKVFLGLDQIYGILIGIGIVIIYSTIGGMRAVIWTDVLQFIVLSVGIPLVLVFGLSKAGGASVVIENVKQVNSLHLSFLGPKTVIAFISLFLTFLLGETLGPPYVQRLFISKDHREVRIGTLLSGIYSFPFFLMAGVLGLIALSENFQSNPNFDPNLALPFMINFSLPIVLKGFVVAGVISIVMSSADSFLNAASVAFVRDIVEPFKRKDKELDEFLLVRIVTIATGILAIIFAIKIENVLDILIYAYHFWAPTILMPLVAGIMGMKVKKQDFFFGMIGGAIGMIIWKFVLVSPFDIDALIPGIMLNAVFFSVSKYFIKGSPKTSSKSL